MEIFTIEMIWYIFSVTCLLLYYVYVSKKDWEKFRKEIKGWEEWSEIERGAYNRLLDHSNWLDSSLKRMSFKYEEEKKIKENILVQARNWKRLYLLKEKQLEFYSELLNEVEAKNKDLHKKIVNDSRPLQGAKKTWKIKKPNTISRSQVYRRKKEVCEQ